ncbi:MAG: hypothetical protein H6709_11435 [Kofleriaceae bacterium]|nr:hypothetical protein [Kofleriaceae bacterium]
MARALSILVAVIAVAAAGNVSRAQAGAGRDVPPPWRAPAGCPTAGEFLDYLGAAMGEPVGADQLVIEAVVERDGDRWRATIHDLDGGVRILRAPSCDELAHATALVMAMAHDADPVRTAPPVALPRVAAATPSRRAPAGDPEVTAEVDDASDAAAAPPPGRTLRLRATVDGDLGAFDGVAPGWGVAIELGHGHSATDVAVVETVVGDPATGGFSHAGYAVTGRRCRLGARGATRVGACAALEVESFDAWAFGAAPATGWALGSGFGVTGGVALAAGVELRADLSLIGRFVRPTFPSSAFDPSPVGPSPLSLRLGLAIQARLF